MDDLLLREIEAYIKFVTDTEKEDRNTLIKELPDRLRNRLSIYLYERIRSFVYFFDIVSDNQEFIRWVTPKLKEIIMIDGSLMQQEHESLTHIHFIMEGTADYCHNKTIPYYEIKKGMSFGIEDIFFRMNEAQVKFAQ